MINSLIQKYNLLSKNRAQPVIIAAAIILFYVIAFRGVVFQPGYIYQNWDNAIPPFSEQMKNLADFSKSTWWSAPDMGTPSAWSGMNRYFDMIVLEGLAPLGGKFVGKWLNMIYALVGGLGVWVICRQLGWGLLMALPVVLLSQFNPKTYSLVISGHILHQGFAYSLAPWLIILIFRTVNSESMWGYCACIISAGVIGTLITSASAFGVVYFGLFFLTFIIAFSFHRRWGKLLIGFFVVSLIVLILNIHWIMPARAISSEVDASFKFNQTVAQTRDNYIALYHNFSTVLADAFIGHTDNNGMATEYVYPISDKTRFIWKTSAYLLLALAVCGLFFKGQKNWKLFAVLCLLIGVILFAGDKTYVGRIFYENILLKYFTTVFFLMTRTARWLIVYYFGLA